MCVIESERMREIAKKVVYETQKIVFLFRDLISSSTPRALAHAAREDYID